MPLFQSREDFVADYQAKHPEFGNVGPRTLYSTLVKLFPDTASQVSGDNSPFFRTTDEFLLNVREADPGRYANAPDSAVAQDLMVRSPQIAKAWGLDALAVSAPASEPVEQEDDFGRAFPNWIGRRPGKSLDQYKNGKRLQTIMEANLSGDPAGFWSSLAGRGGRDWMPFATDAMDNIDLAKVILTSKRLMADGSDKNVSDEDLLDFNLYMSMAARESEGGWKSMAGSAVRQSLVMMGEFALWTAGMASGLFSAGVGTEATAAATGPAVAAKVGAAGLRKWVKKAIGEGLSEKIEKKLASQLAVRGGKLVDRNAAFYIAHDEIKEGIKKGVREAVEGKTGSAVAGKAAALVSGQLVNALPAAVMTAGTQLGVEGLSSLAATGEFDTKQDRLQKLNLVLSGQNNDPETRIARSMMYEFIENFTEFTGGDLMSSLEKVFGVPARMAAGVTAEASTREALKQIGRAIAKKADEAGGVAQAARQKLARGVAALSLASKTGGLQNAVKQLQKYGYNGFFGEYAEERLGGFLHGLIGDEGSPDDNAVKRAFGNLFPGTSDEAIAEAVALAVPMVGGATLQQAGNLATTHSARYNAIQHMFRFMLGPEAEIRRHKGGEVNLKETETEGGKKAANYGGREITASDSQARTAVNQGLVEGYDFYADQGPVMNMVNALTDKVFGIRWLSQSRSPDGRRGFHKSIAELIASNDAPEFLGRGISQMELVLKQPGFEDWSKVRNAQPPERGGDSVAWARRSELLHKAADVVSGQIMEDLRPYSSLVSLTRFFSEPELEAFLLQQGVKMTPERMKELNQAEPEVYKALESGALQGLVHRDADTGQLYLIDAAYRVFNGEQGRMKLDWAHLAALKARGINPGKIDLGALREDMKTVGAGPLQGEYLAALEQQLATAADEASKTKLAAVKRLRDTIATRMPGLTQSTATLEEINDPKTSNPVAQIIQQAFRPDPLHPQYLSLKASLGFRNTAASDEEFQRTMRDLGTVVQAHMRGEIYAPGARVTLKSQRNQENPEQFEVQVVDGNKTTVKSVFDGRIFSGLAGDFVNSRPLERIALVPNMHISFVGAVKDMEQAGVTPLSLAERMDPKVRPVKEVLRKNAKGEDERDPDASVFETYVTAFNSGDGSTLFVGTPTGAVEDLLEAAIKRETEGTLKGHTTSIGKRPVLNVFSALAAGVAQALESDLAAAREGERRIKDQQAKQSLLSLLTEKDEAVRGQSLFELQQKVEMLGPMGHAASSRGFGLRSEAELFARIAKELPKGKEALAQLHAIFSSVAGAKYLGKLSYRGTMEPVSAEVPETGEPETGEPETGNPPTPAPPASGDDLMKSNLEAAKKELTEKLDALRGKLAALASKADAEGDTEAGRAAREALISEIAAAERELDSVMAGLALFPSTATEPAGALPREEFRPVQVGGDGDNESARTAASVGAFIEWAKTRPSLRGVDPKSEAGLDALALALSDRSGVVFRNVNTRLWDYETAKSILKSVIEGKPVSTAQDEDSAGSEEDPGVDKTIFSDKGKELASLRSPADMLVEYMLDEMLHGDVATATQSFKSLDEFADLVHGTWADPDVSLERFPDAPGATLDERRAAAAQLAAERSPLYSKENWDAFRKAKVSDGLGRIFHAFLSYLPYESALAIAPRLLTRDFVQLVEVRLSGSIYWTPEGEMRTSVDGISTRDLNAQSGGARHQAGKALASYLGRLAASGEEALRALEARITNIIGELTPKGTAHKVRVAWVKEKPTDADGYWAFIGPKGSTKPDFVRAMQQGGISAPRLPAKSMILDGGKAVRFGPNKDIVVTGERVVKGLLDLIDDALVSVAGNATEAPWHKYNDQAREALLLGSARLRDAVAMAGKFATPEEAARVADEVYDEYFDLMANSVRSSYYLLKEILVRARSILANPGVETSQKVALMHDVAFRRFESGWAPYLGLVMDHVSGLSRRTSVRLDNESTLPTYLRNSPLLRLTTTVLKKYASKNASQTGQAPLALIVLDQRAKYDAEGNLVGGTRINLPPEIQNVLDTAGKTDDQLYDYRDDVEGSEFGQVAYPGASSANLEYRAAVAANRAAARTGSDFLYPIPVADKDLTYYFRMDRKTVLGHLAKLARTETLDPSKGQDLIRAMDDLVLPELVMAGYLGLGEAKKLIESGKYGKRVRVVTTPGDLYPIVKGGLPARYNGFVATKYIYTDATGDHELVEPLNGGQFYSDRIAQGLAVSRGRKGTVPFVKAMDYISVMLKAMNHHVSPLAEADTSGLYKAVQQVLANPELGVDSFTDTGAAKIFPRRGEEKTVVVDLPGGKLAISGFIVPRWGAHFFETTNMVRPTAPKDKIFTVSIPFNMSAATDQQVGLAKQNQRLLELYGELSDPTDSDLQAMAEKAMAGITDPDTARLAASGKSFRMPIVSQVVLQILVSKLRRAMVPRGPQNSSILVPGEPTQASRSAFRDPMLRPASFADGRYLPAWSKLNVSSAKARYAMRLKPGATLDAVASALLAYRRASGDRKAETEALLALVDYAGGNLDFLGTERVDDLFVEDAIDPGAVAVIDGHTWLGGSVFIGTRIPGGVHGVANGLYRLSVPVTYEGRKPGTQNYGMEDGESVHRRGEDFDADMFYGKLVNKAVRESVDEEELKKMVAEAQAARPYSELEGLYSKARSTVSRDAGLRTLAESVLGGDTPATNQAKAMARRVLQQTPTERENEFAEDFLSQLAQAAPEWFEAPVDEGLTRTQKAFLLALSREGRAKEAQRAISRALVLNHFESLATMDQSQVEMTVNKEVADSVWLPKLGMTAAEALKRGKGGQNTPIVKLRMELRQTASEGLGMRGILVGAMDALALYDLHDAVRPVIRDGKLETKEQRRARTDLVRRAAVGFANMAFDVTGEDRLSLLNADKSTAPMLLVWLLNDEEIDPAVEAKHRGDNKRKGTVAHSIQRWVNWSSMPEMDAFRRAMQSDEFRFGSIRSDFRAKALYNWANLVKIPVKHWDDFRAQEILWRSAQGAELSLVGRLAKKWAKGFKSTDEVRKTGEELERLYDGARKNPGLARIVDESPMLRLTARAVASAKRAAKLVTPKPGEQGGRALVASAFAAELEPFGADADAVGNKLLVDLVQSFSGSDAFASLFVTRARGGKRKWQEAGEEIALMSDAPRNLPADFVRDAQAFWSKATASARTVKANGNTYEVPAHSILPLIAVSQAYNFERSDGGPIGPSRYEGGIFSLLPESVFKRIAEYVEREKPPTKKMVSVAAKVEAGARPPETKTGAPAINVWHASGERPELSNLAARKFTFKGRVFRSVEHAYQSLKSGKFDEATSRKYAFAKSVEGLKIAGTLPAKTEGDYNLTLMHDLVLASFRQNPAARDALLATGEAPFSHSQADDLWKDEFPRILATVRSELRAERGDAETPPPSTATVDINDAIDSVQYQGRTPVSAYLMRLGEYPPDAAHPNRLEALRALYSFVKTQPFPESLKEERDDALAALVEAGKTEGSKPKYRPSTATVSVSDVSKDGEVRLRFSGKLTPKEIRYYSDNTWTLEKALAESGYTKAAIEQIKKFEPTGKARGSLEEIVRAAEAATMRPVALKRNLGSAGLRDNAHLLGQWVVMENGQAAGNFHRTKEEAEIGYEGPGAAVQFTAETAAELGFGRGFYESLSVNKGQGTYMEVDILSDFPVPGQHGDFNKPNQLGWFRARAYADGTIEIQEFQTAMATLFEFADWSDQPKTLASINTALAKLRERLAQEKAAGKDTRATENRIGQVEDARGQADGFDAPWAWRGPNNETFLMNALGKDKTHEEVFVNAITQWARNQGAAPAIPAGHTRLYRAQSKTAPLPSAQYDFQKNWIVDTPEGRAQIDAFGRWWTDDLAEAQWYIENEYPSGDGQIVYFDIPTSEAEKYRVSNMPLKPGGKGVAENPAAYSRRPDKEFWLPRGVANQITAWQPLNQGFTKVRFPTGETAARVEGHQTLADRLAELRARRDSLVVLEKEHPGVARELEQYALMPLPDYFTTTEIDEDGTQTFGWERTADGQWTVNGNPVFESAARRAFMEEARARLTGAEGALSVSELDANIQNLKTQGIEKLAPIEAFYENRVGKIVSAMGAKPVTDANGNTWREVTLGPSAPSTATAKELVDNAKPSIYKAFFASGPSSDATPSTDALVANLISPRDFQRRGGRETLRALAAHPRLKYNPVRHVLTGLADQLQAKEGLLAETTTEPPRQATPKQGVLDFNAPPPNTSTEAPYLTQRRNADARMRKLGVPVELADRDPVLRAALEGYRQGYSADASATEVLAHLAQGRADEAEQAIEASAMQPRDKELAKQGVALAADIAAQAAVDAVSEPSPESGVTTSTVTARDVAYEFLRYYETIGGTKRVHHLLKRMAYLVNAEEQASARFMLRERSVFYADTDMTKMVRMVPSKDAGKRDFAKRWRDRWLGPKFESDDVYRFTEPERNLLSRVMLAERALRAGDEFVVYGGSGAFKGRKFSPDISSKTDANGVPLGHLERVDDILAEFKASELHRKYLEFGRTEEDLDIRALSKRVAKRYDDMHRSLNELARWAVGPGELMHYRERYVALNFGRPGFPHAQLRDAEKAVEVGIRAGSETGLKATNEFGLPKSVFDAKLGRRRVAPPRELFDLFKRLAKELDALRGEDYSERRLNRVASSDLRELNAALLGLARQVEVDKALRDGANYKMDPVRADLIAALRNTTNNYVAREYTERAMERMYDSPLDAYMKSEGLLVPRQVDPFTDLVSYTREVTDAAKRQLLSAAFMATPGDNGLPLVIGIPNMEELARKTDETRLIHDDAIRLQVDWLAGEAGLATVPGSTPSEQLDWLLKSGKLNLSSYGTEESPYDSFSGFYVAPRAKKLFRHVTGRPPQLLYDFGGAQKDFAKQLMDTTLFMKHMAVSWSLFFGTAGIESVVAGTGLRDNILAPGKNFAFKRLRDAMKAGFSIYRQLERGDAALDSELYDMHMAGLDISERTISDTATSVVDRGILWMKGKVAEVHGDAVAEKVEKYARFASGRWLSEALMGKFFPTLKLWAAKDMARRVHDRMPELTREQVLREIAPSVNMAYGGLPWDEYEWATPNFTFFLNLGLFAPQWTLAALNVAGAGKLTGHLMENYLTPEGERFVFAQNWPAMYLVALQLIPNLIQAGIYAAAGGDDDKALAWNNELGKGGFFPSIDVTPLVRHFPGYTGDKTGKRRVYIQFGKQSYEVLDGWIPNAKNQLLRKTSMLVKLVWEQIFGSSPGSPDFALPFAGKGLAGWWTSGKGFMGSRIGTMLQKFTPMTASQLLQKPETGPLAFLVPASKGMNETKAIEQMAKILMTYADAKSFEGLRGNNAMRGNLLAMTGAYVDALERNGYDGITILDRARGQVLPWFYGEFFKAFQAHDEAGMEEAARKIARLGGTSKSIAASFASRKQAANRGDMTPEEKAAVEAAFDGVYPEIQEL